MDSLADKVAVITGAASGIGFALAESCAGHGMRLVLADVEEQPLQAAAERLRSAGTDVLAVATDVSNAESMDALAARSLERFGAVHLICNNAGVGAAGAMWELSTRDWEFVLGPNLWGVIHGVRVFARLLVDQNEGHIVNTASFAGLVSSPRMGPYNVSKHGVVTLSETLQMELAEAGSAVGVSVLCPGFVNTRIFDHERHRSRAGYAASEASSVDGGEARARLLEAAVHFMEPKDVAEQVLRAVLERRFYVLTHEGTQEAVRARMEGIIANTSPRHDAGMSVVAAPGD